MIKNYIKDSLAGMFKDKQILQKSTFLFLLILLYSYSKLFAFNLFVNTDKVNLSFPNYAVLTIFSLIVIFLINGYKTACIKNLISQSELPFLNMKKHFGIGVKYTLAAALFYLPLFYLIVGCGFFTGFVVITEHAVMGIFATVLMIMLALLILIAVLYNFLCLIGFNRIFAETNDWLSFLNFKKLFALVKDNKKLYFVSVGILCLLAFLDSLVLFVVNPLFINMDIAYLTIVPAALISVYEFYVGVFVASKFTEYQAGQHQ